MSIADDLRAQIEKIKPKPEQIYSIHNKIRTLTNRFDVPGPEMRDVLDFDIPRNHFPVPVRLYVPKGASRDAGPCLIYLHGGGFVTCSIDSHEGVCLRIADSAKVRVLSVDYRLAPQYPFPAGPDDCLHALEWALEGKGLVQGIDPSRIAIAGDSAGGNMAAYLAQKFRTDLRAQILYYPLMQMAEVRPNKPGPQDMLQLGVVALNFIKKHYVVDADVHDPRISPLFENNLSGLPPTQILTCGLDPLRVEGRLYKEKLQACGVKVEYLHEKALPHGFLNFSRAFPKAQTIPVASGQFLRKHLKPRLKSAS
ncbi:MAG TPA: alpha/beta hydrolase [Hellea balneolensis]|uniref:Alpha/beta hydrolase n=1 Tax=Hellea balneolensis TaxID=287478 RepID=A0A7C5R528_9PROT|nr:alpha/beta hydrolase [Hellea balneolensis]